jgi:uncharacterized protein (TIGR02246 family)
MRLFSAIGLLAMWHISVEANGADDSEVEAIRKAGAAYVKAIEDGNRETMLAAWAEDGDYIDATGRSANARELIRHELTEGSGGRRGGRGVTVDRIRLITPEVAVEDGSMESGSEPGGPALRSRYTAIWQKRDGRWLLNSLRESMVPLPPRNTRLQELAWLLGEFAGHADDGSLVVSSAVFSPDGNYILRDLSVTFPDRSVRSLNQRIGWDPISGSFKSWTFDADGSYGEGGWKRQGGSWIVNTSGVSANGKRNLATNIYSRISADEFVLESVGATEEGVLRPDIKVQLKRQPSEE